MNEDKSNFIKTIIENDIKKHGKNYKIATRFPPEPNGYLHIGHAKAIVINFTLANNYDGFCNLRFDDTNPEKEEIEYIEAIKNDIKWLGFSWKDQPKYSSDYFKELCNLAKKLIKLNKAYVCDLSYQKLKDYRGTLTEPGIDSPNRNRTIEENLLLFQKMIDGKFEDGSCTLRAKIDMGSGNLNMRDPVIYRMKKVKHHRTGDDWYIYPMYDFTHCLSDYFEKITHSLCTLEFQDHRQLYDWFLDNLVSGDRPHQYEFSRLNLSYSVTSKRKMKLLVDHGKVFSWDDPRMLTLAGLRRRGYTPQAIKNFIDNIGTSKKESFVPMTLLEDSLRNDLNKNAKRAMCVLDPIKIIIKNYPIDKETIKAPLFPQKDINERETRQIEFSKTIFIERDDFLEIPSPKFKRLYKGGSVRLRYAYVITCLDIKYNDSGEISELICEYDPETLGGKKPKNKKVNGIIHWVSDTDSIEINVNLYDRLFKVNKPTEVDNNSDELSFFDNLNPESLICKKSCRGEVNLLKYGISETVQFERLGYFCLDKDSSDNEIIWNRAVSLKETWNDD